MSSTAPVEVRTCPKCQAPAVVQVFAWTHTTFGTKTGAITRELRCQQCGKLYVIHPKMKAVALIIAGVLLLPTCIGIPFLALGWWRWTMEGRLPLAIGAPPPLMRFKGGPPQRTCGSCSGTAIAMRITRHTHNGIPTGTEYEYVCSACKKEFTVESPGGQLFSAFGSLLLGVGSFAFFVAATHPGWRFGGGLACAALALFLGYQVIDRLANRFRHPARPDADAFIG